MTSTSGELEALRCPLCKGTFSPPRVCCPRCGQRSLSAGRLPAEGVVLASTELAVPTSEWPAPHPLLLVELAEGMRVLATCRGPIPVLGATVKVLRSGSGYSIP
ncbi:MAG: hypothetical protein L3K08_04825 [Thermoplasmata archaeon]|nr:hypothetical protein [Thermoplasmata archaeon]